MSNHSGGALTPDPLVLGPAFYKTFGYHRPLYILAHYGVFFTPLRGYLCRLGAVHANRENAGYVKVAVETSVPVVPVVSIGAQQTQLFLRRADQPAKWLGLHRFRLDTLPVSAGSRFSVLG